MENYKSNSHKLRETRKTQGEKHVEKVISGQAKIKKRSEFRKFADVFMPDDINSVKSFVMFDVIIPGVKRAIRDIVDLFLYGEIDSRGINNQTAPRKSYERCYNKSNNIRTNTSKAYSGYNYEPIIVNNRGEAEKVLTRMIEIIEEFEMVSVSDLYELVGIDGDWTDNKYGWTDLSDASVTRVRDGYMLDLPRAVPLN